MKSRLHLFLLPALIAGLSIIPAGLVTAQTFTTLHTFDGNDGATPWASLTSSGNTLYGTTAGKGKWGNGTVFAVNTDGTGFTNLHSFDGYPSDGTDPQAGLVLSGNTLYGTAGTVFAINTNGTGFTNLYSFTATSDPYYTNSDGDSPNGLILSGNTLYGTAAYGGRFGNGTVFAVNINGTGFTNLHSFKALIPYYTNSFGDVFGTNSDGANPLAGLILSGNTLYGTAWEGGSSGEGTVFAVRTDGTSFTNLHSFSATLDPYYTNSDGAGPEAGLILSGNTLYGTTVVGGSSGIGTVFAVNTNGTSFTNLHNFTYGNGGYPYAGLVLSGNTLYGTASDYWNDFFYGTVFSLSFQPQLTITPSGAKVILSWPTNVAGFDYTGYILQSTTNLASPGVWTTNSPAPAVVSGQNTVTNPIAGPRKFYRLRMPQP
jgi:uncharacterized repeat protein (TIGR03803 family)